MKLILPANKKSIEKNLEKFSKIKNENLYLLTDKIKEFGFSFAKFSGLSIGLKDINGLIKKNKYFSEKDRLVKRITNLWERGVISFQEYETLSLTLWSDTTSLINGFNLSIYKKANFFDPLNLLIVSGARGSWSQLFQLSEFRGLLLDQDGKILTIPSRNNFKQGLSLLDYSISFYSSRKGIIDTAINTATAGYLTRRLVFLAQDVLIKKHDCFTGEIIGSNSLKPFLSFFNNNSVITKKNLKHNFKFYKKNVLRNILVCATETDFCQKCYGFDIIYKNLIPFGSAVGVIAAQSVSEPTTQMTLKTFHTGGAATSNDSEKTLLNNNSGRLILPKKLLGSITYNQGGNSKLHLNNNQKISIKTWAGKISSNLLLKNVNLTTKEFFIKKNFLFRTDNFNDFGSITEFQPYYSSYNGELNFKSAIVKKEYIFNSFVNSVTTENSKLEFFNSNHFLFDLDTFFVFLKSFFSNIFLSEKKLVLNHFKFLNVIETPVLKFFIDNITFNNFLETNLLKYNDLFTVFNVKNEKIKFNNVDSINVFNKTSSALSILIKKTVNLKNIKIMKLNPYTYVGVEPGIFLTKKEMVGFLPLLENRDEDIIDTVGKMDLIFEASEAINHNKIFSPFLDVNRVFRKQDFVTGFLAKKIVSSKDLLRLIFAIQERKDENLKASQRAMTKFKLILSNSFSSLYSSQDVKVLNRHFEVLITKLTKFSVLKKFYFNSSFQPKNFNITFIDQNKQYSKNFFSLFNNKVDIMDNNDFNIFFHFKTFKENEKIYYKKWVDKKIVVTFLLRTIKMRNVLNSFFMLKKLNIVKKYSNLMLPAKPIFLDEGRSIKRSNQFLLNSLFSKGKVILAVAAISGTTNWLSNLRENVIIGSLPAAGSSIYCLKESFTSQYFFKNNQISNKKK